MPDPRFDFKERKVAMQSDTQECLTMTLTQVAKALGTSRNGIYLAATRNQIPGLIRIGRRWLVSKRALDRALEQGWPPKQS